MATVGFKGLTSRSQHVR